MTDFRNVEAAPTPERDPSIERKCDACMGDGMLPVIDFNGEQRGVARCPICEGTRYAD